MVLLLVCFEDEDDGLLSYHSYHCLPSTLCYTLDARYCIIGFMGHPLTTPPLWISQPHHDVNNLPYSYETEILIQSSFSASHRLVRWPSGYGASFRLTWNEFTSEKSRGFESHSDHHPFAPCLFCDGQGYGFVLHDMETAEV
jgi:hypothetical protein